jgi:hypothetical protein
MFESRASLGDLRFIRNRAKKVLHLSVGGGLNKSAFPFAQLVRQASDAHIFLHRHHGRAHLVRVELAHERLKLRAQSPLTLERCAPFVLRGQP